MPQEPTWLQVTDLCMPALRSCAGPTCMGLVGFPFDSALCVAASGDHYCPQGYPQRSVHYTGYVDGRACSSCECGWPAGGTCAQATLYPCTGCTGTGMTLGAGQCLPVDGNTMNCGSGPAIRSVRFDTTVTGGACAPSGGQLSGALQPDGPVTLCCP